MGEEEGEDGGEDEGEDEKNKRENTNKKKNEHTLYYSVILTKQDCRLVVFACSN